MRGRFKTAFLLISSCFVVFALYAKEDIRGPACESKMAAVSKSIIEAKTVDGLAGSFEGLKNCFFAGHKYTDFVEFLKSLGAKKDSLGPLVDYYIALSRYNQLKYLEEAQNWDEYFAEGNTYRDDITSYAQKAVEEASSRDALHIKALLLLWNFHNDQQDVFTNEALVKLMDAVLEYAQNETADLTAIKAVADGLSAGNQKSQAHALYKIYADKLSMSGMGNNAIKNIALAFYNEGNLNLSEVVYDIYIRKISPSASKETLLQELSEIADKFSYNNSRLSDPSYAQKIFTKVEEACGKDALNEDMLYKQALNAEKAGDYKSAAGLYEELLQRFAQTKYAEKANLKIALFNAFILADVNKAKSYFEKITAGIYYLGLLSQWENDYAKALGYYEKVLAATGADMAGIIPLAQERLNEINNQEPLEYNLKSFLDLALTENKPQQITMEDIGLKAMPSEAQKDAVLNISAISSLGQTGCMQPDLQYLWSGETGKAKPAAQQSEFETQYGSAGVKVINLVVVSPTGLVGKGVVIIDVD